MQPVVDRLEASYVDQIVVERLNAADGDAGQATFDELRLPGHPSIVIFLSDGTEVVRLFGVVTEDALLQEIQAVLTG
jgi:thiol:disulfide interchange protein